MLAVSVFMLITEFITKAIDGTAKLIVKVLKIVNRFYSAMSNGITWLRFTAFIAGMVLAIILYMIGV